jgi:hypothetical protein
MTAPEDETRLWPASPFDLADAHRCPSCFTAISTPVCATCGFALTDARAPRVLELGRRILSTELERQKLMDEILLAHAPVLSPPPPLMTTMTDAAPAAEVITTPLVPEAAIAMAGVDIADSAVAAPEITTTPVSSGEPATTTPPMSSTAPAAVGVAIESIPASAPRGGGAAPGSPAEATASAPRRRLTVPVLLLIVGVSLVGIAAVFFLLLAWFVAGIAVRALIIGGITLATIALASWLRRRELTATAEGIGALGVVLLALDAWAVRANDLFAAGSADGAVYAGVSALVIAVLCRGWARVSRLRGPDLAASLALPAGLGFVVGGLTSLPPMEALTAGLLGAAAGGLVHALPAPFSSARAGAAGVPERLVLAVTGLAALIAAGVTARGFTGDAVPVVLWSGAGLVALGAAHAWLARRSVEGERLPGAGVLEGVASGVAVAAAGTTGWVLATRTELPLYTVLVAPVVAAAVAFGVDLMRTRRGARPWLPAAIVSAVVAGVSLVVAGDIWLSDAATVIQRSWTVWRTDPFALPAGAPEQPYLALVGAAVIAALLLLAPTMRRTVARVAVPVVATLLLLAAAAYTGVPVVVAGAGILLAAAAIAVVGVGRTRLTADTGDADAAPDARTDREAAAAWARSTRAGWVVAGALAVAVAYTAGVVTPWLWLVGVAAAILYPIGIRLVVRPTGEAAVIAALAPVVIAALSTVFAPAALSAATGLVGAEQGVTLALLLWVALAALGAAIALPVERASQAALAITAEILVAGALVWMAVADGLGMVGPSTSGLLAVIGEPAFGILRGSLLFAGFATIALGLTRLTGLAATMAAALTAPVAASAAFDALRTFEVRGEEWAPVALTAAAVIVPAATAVAVLIRRRSIGEAGDAPERALSVRRLAADLGAAAAVAVVAWPVSAWLQWAVLALVALGFAAASVTRGWAAPRTGSVDDVFATPRAGVTLSAGWRRLLAWPTAGAAIAAWWSWLTAGTPGIEYTVESYVVPAAVLLVAFAALLVRLRRRIEASVAVGLGLAVGLWPPAIEGWAGEQLRGTIVALVAVSAALALAFTPARRIRPVAPVGAGVAIAGLGLVAVERAGDGPGWQVLWLVLLVAVAYASATGLVLAQPGHASARAYAWIVPGAALIAAVGAILPLADEPRIVAGTLIMLGGLHLASAGLDRLPLTSATRWISLAGAAAVGAAGWWLGAATEIEAVSLPVAGMCLLGAVLAMLRRRSAGAVWPDVEGAVWIAGLLLAAAPSLLAQQEAARAWAYVAVALLAAAGVAALREPLRTEAPPRAHVPPVGAMMPPGPVAPPAATVAGAPRSRFAVASVPAPAPPPRLFPDVWSLRAPTAILLAAAALAMGVRGLIPPGFASDTAAAVVASVGGLIVAVLLTGTAMHDWAMRAASVLGAAGAALLVVVVATQPQGDLVTTTVIAAIGGAVGVGGAAVLGLERWRRLGAVLAVAGLVVAVVACGIRFLWVAADPGLEADLWAVAGAGVAAAIALAALRATPSPRVGRAAGAGFAVACVLFTAAESILLSLHEEGADIRTVVVMSALTVAAAVGAAARARLGLSLAISAAIAGALFGLAALTAFGVRPIELVTVAPAVGGILYGARTLRRNPAARTWPALGPWLALLTIPSLTYDLRGAAPWMGESGLWRIVGLGVVAIAMVVVGAVWRLQAPLLLGSAVLLLHAAAQLWPWISAAYVAVPWWLWLGIGGALLIFIAARYEKRMRALRTAFLAVASLR